MSAAGLHRPSNAAASSSRRATSHALQPDSHTSSTPASSTSSATDTESTRARRAAKTKPRRVEDIKGKQCWVCYATQDEDADAGTPDRKWVHACSCTLVAHADCLLAWYATDVANKQAPPCCPVCATPYQVTEDRSTLLAAYKRLVRRWDKLSVALATGGAAAGVHLVLSAYGAFAIRAFAGEHVARSLLWSHDRLPLRYWLNLPLIPITLVLSRTPLLDSILPFGPLALVLSSTPHPGRSDALMAHDPLGLSNLSFTYPPSPTLTLCLLPFMRIAYLKIRHKVFDFVLGRTTRLEGGLAGLMETVRAADEGDFEAGTGPGRFEVVAEVEMEERVIEEDDDEDDERAQQGREHNHAGAHHEHPPRIVNNRMRVGLSRLTSLVIGALLYPSVCSAAGSILFFLASRQASRPRPAWPIALLRKILGVQAIIAARAASSTASSSSSSFAGSSLLLGGSFASYLKVLFSSPKSLGMPGSAQALVDPVWVRNAIGGALVLLARDAIELGAGVLEVRRKLSRRIVGRAFGDQLELDTESTAAPPSLPENQTTTTWSAGRDANGREAVVTSLL